MISWSEDTGLQLGNNFPERIGPFSPVKIWILIFLSKPCILRRVFLRLCFYVWIVIPDLMMSAFQLNVVNTKPKLEELSIKIKETIAKRSQWVLEAKTSKLPEERENAIHQVEIGVSFASDWLRWWREWSWPIKERSKAKPKVISDCLSTLNWKLLCSSTIITYLLNLCEVNLRPHPSL